MGDHLDVHSECRSDLLNFKLRYFQLISNGFGSDSVCDYDAIDPYTASSATYPACSTSDTTDAHHGTCCFTDRHADHRSMYYLSDDNTGQNFKSGVPIGQNVYGSESSAMTSGDLNGDGEISLPVFLSAAHMLQAAFGSVRPHITAQRSTA